MKRIIAFLLVLCMVLSMAACGAPAEKPQQNEPSNQNLQAADPEELDRQDKELVAELIGGTDASDLTDQELDALVDQLIGDTEKEAGVVNLGNKQEAPKVEFTADPDAYDEDGAMKEPFDQVYPELIEKEQVKFSGESILLKLKSGKLTDGLKAAGVGALHEIVPLENAAWYEAKLTEGTDAQKALAAVRELDEVLLAEYNYEVQIAALDDYKHFDKEQDEDFKKNGHNKDQWHFHYVGIPDGYEEMETEGGDPSVIVAVIDSGVDYTHEDLKDNMWVNTKEIPDNNIDDDKNGYIDDYYGVDIVAGKGNGDDTNGHGTHVAGIVAARNNNVGTLGVAYNVKIMSVKAAMHNGTLNQADIAEAILYAYNHGAEVINMSFGGTACSIAVQDALATAYTRSVLVASAGNNGAKNEGMMALPNYPAALTYVLGVMSVDETGRESAFTNWDVEAFNGVEYELYAPGENIMSTLPGNQYGYLSGTSMAAPIVSSFAAILRSEFTDRDKYPTKFIYGQLASTSGYYADCLDPELHGFHNLPQIVNLNDALTKLPKPEVGVQDYALFDDPKYSSKNNGDGVIDAGETIALGLTLRNRWGMSENTLVTIDTKSANTGISDPYITIQNPTVNYGSVGTYSTQDCGKVYTDELHTGWEDPFLITISEDCPNDYRFTLNITVTCENALDAEDDTVYESKGSLGENVRSGYILPSIIEEDMVLTKDNLYIIPNATVIQAGVTVRVEPGTHIQFWSDDANDPYASSYIAYLLVNGTFLVEGTKEEPVYIYPSQLMDHYGVEIGASSTGYVSMKYADITNFFYSTDHTGTQNKINLADHCTFRMNYVKSLYYRTLSSGKVTSSSAYSISIGSITAKDSVFYKLGYGGYSSTPDTTRQPTISGSANRCVFVDCGVTLPGNTQNCVLLGNSCRYSDKHYSPSTKTAVTVSKPSVSDVYYREETGTTYLRATSSIPAIYLELLGAKPVIIETKEEQTWMRTNITASKDYKYVVGFSHNGEQFVWSDGTELASFVDPDGKAKTTVASSSFYLSYQMYAYNSSSMYNYWLYELPGHILPTEITFSEYEVNIDTAATYQITPLNLPVQLPLDAFVYESENEAVLQVSETGLVTPVGKGSADVYVYSKDRAVCNYVTFHVMDYVALESAAFPVESMRMACGTTENVACILSPVDTTRKNVIYTSSNEAIATVDTAGNVTATGFGAAEIIATIEEFELHLPVVVTLDALTLESDYAELAIGEKRSIAYATDPVGTAVDVLTYTSSDEAVLTVDAKGNMTGVASGTATVTVSCGALTAQQTVKVYKKATKVSLLASAYTIALDGEPMALPKNQISSEPYQAEINLQWSTQDESIAKVENGMIVPVSVGATVLYATDTRSGAKAWTALYVTEKALASAVAVYPGIYDTYYNNSYDFMILLEDGSLYHIKSNQYEGFSKELLYENVKDFDRSGDVHMALFQDGTVKVVDPNSSEHSKEYDFFVGMDPQGIACYPGQYFVYTNNELYSWGYNNDNGQLGDGGYNEPEETEFEWYYGDIWDVVTVKGMTLIDIYNGMNGCSELMMMGGDYNQYRGPVRIGKNVNQIRKVNSSTYSCREVVYSVYDDETYENVWYRFSTQDAVPVQETRMSGMYYESLSSWYSIRCNGEWIEGREHKTIYVEEFSGDYASSRGQVEGVYDIAAACVDDNYIWAVSHDGTIYQIDPDNLSSYYQSDVVTTFPLADIGETQPQLQVIGTNLLEEQILSQDRLVLELSHPVYAGNDDWDLLYNDGSSTSWLYVSAISITESGGTVFSIKPNTYGHYAFKEGYKYKVRLSAWCKGVNNAVLRDDLEVVFTYQPNAVPQKPEASEPTTPDETVTVHQSVLDTTIARIPSMKSVNAELKKLYEELRVNPYFYGNAILNPISTDTNVEHWLRIQAPTVSVGTYSEVPLGGNYWGSTNETAIGLQMIDYADFPTNYARLMYAPYLTEAPENTFPFVTSVKLFNKKGEEVKTVGNEQVTFQVKFNRDMDTAIPLQVRFGSAYPYGDYEIAGKYVDARTWEGVYTLNTVIENGNQFFTISNGCSATEDLPLQIDQHRFGFVIDTTAAQALIMQATSTETGISLRWTQDDFDTLMGYNVYRATSEDGLYTRLNKTVIPANTLEWFDDTVEPGKVYYYNFTVVQTDLAESEPSGKIAIMSKDTMAPNIYHSPVSSAFTGANLVLGATVTDNLNIAYANLYYRVAGTETWSTIRMNKLNDQYSAIIPASYITVAGVEYYIEAFDGVSFTYKGSVDAPYTVAVQQAIDANALGDVDGDGVITNLDALKLLYAINDKYNMKPEEFARADLNGDGQLWAAEALRILQYVSGAVGSVKM